jgi:polyisoprenyl-phosphate glycosyltransferase
MLEERTAGSTPSIDFIGALYPIEVSVVVPAFNEEDNLVRIVSVLEGILRASSSSFEIVIVNDGSSDGTEAKLTELEAGEHCVKAVNLSRNFGKEAAMAAGLEVASGKCIVFIDADLQHPPELIPEMLAYWRRGSDVVNAVKRDRGNESITYRLFAGTFNRIMSFSIGADASGACDFKLIDRQVANALRNCPERNRFFRGLVAWVGYKVENLSFDVHERNAGVTKWSTLSLIKYSIRNALAFSSLPLIGVAYAGFFVIFLGILLFAQTLYNYLSGEALSGFTTVIAVQILLSGMILFSLGIIAIYIARIYDEQKSRPMFIIRKNR